MVAATNEKIIFRDDTMSSKILKKYPSNKLIYFIEMHRKKKYRVKEI